MTQVHLALNADDLATLENNKEAVIYSKGITYTADFTLKGEKKSSQHTVVSLNLEDEKVKGLLLNSDITRMYGSAYNTSINNFDWVNAINKARGHTVRQIAIYAGDEDKFTGFNLKTNSSGNKYITIDLKDPEITGEHSKLIFAIDSYFRDEDATFERIAAEFGVDMASAYNEAVALQEAKVKDTTDSESTTTTDTDVTGSSTDTTDASDTPGRGIYDRRPLATDKPEAKIESTNEGAVVYAANGTEALFSGVKRDGTQKSAPQKNLSYIPNGLMLHILRGLNASIEDINAVKQYMETVHGVSFDYPMQATIDFKDILEEIAGQPDSDSLINFSSFSSWGNTINGYLGSSSHVAITGGMKALATNALAKLAKVEKTNVSVDFSYVNRLRKNEKSDQNIRYSVYAYEGKTWTQVHTWDSVTGLNTVDKFYITDITGEKLTRTRKAKAITPGSETDYIIRLMQGLNVF